MNKTFSPIFLLLLFVSFHACNAQNLETQSYTSKTKNTIIFFNPEIEPAVEEIKQATNDAFFTSVSDHFGGVNAKMLKMEMPIKFDSIDIKDIKDACKYNNAKFAVVPKIKFFKIGLGKYVFSSQVVVSMKLYNEAGEFLSENSYDTFRKKARILGSAENSVKIGTKGAVKLILKDWRKIKNE
ncbi:pyruvate decarboxylase [Frigoriflavimonas asaccharolytica]|uniref:Pyruvate decarboxylase n=1 Tax=Frigoriflavimonas asaccharolytica TaxID=2735899 RepID=A0A8J8G7I3_9FLAO|nr:pyruvate decarboxylase [Frigoriflavimonas asaccharolytica]NRS92603.1 hypothetical protein [Frigoriflavimonas asaccharolytica]